MNTCETCRFWLGSETDNWSGVCRRHAPVQVVQKFKDVFDGVWPRVSRKAWCGDFQEMQELERVPAPVERP